MADGRVERWAPALGVLLFLALLAPMLRQPFWLDETSTWWQIAGGFGEIPRRTLEWPTNSLAHGFIARTAVELLPGRELAARLPSVAAGLGAALLLHATARRLYGEPGAAAAVLSLLGLPVVLESTATARAYALGLLALVAAWNRLLAWHDERRPRDLALWALAAAALSWLHFTLLAGLAAQLPLAVHAWRGAGARERRQAALTAAAAVVVAAPSLAQLLAIAREGRVLGFVGPPRLVATLAALVPPGLAAVLLLQGALPRPPDAPATLPSASGARLVRLVVLPLWLLPVVVAFALAHGPQLQVFHPRYLLAGALGAALGAGAWVARLEPRRARTILAALCLLVPLTARESRWPRLDEVDWRGVSARVAAEIAAPGEPVVTITPFGESRSPAHAADLDPGGHLLSMFAAYPVPATMHGLPSVCNAFGRERLAATWNALDLDRRERVLVLHRDGDRYRNCLAAVAPGRWRRRLASWGRLQLVALERRVPE